MKVGDTFRVPFGYSGTQLARVEAIEGDRVLIRRFRRKSGKWNKRCDAYSRANLDRLRTFGNSSAEMMKQQ